MRWESIMCPRRAILCCSTPVMAHDIACFSLPRPTKPDRKSSEIPVLVKGLHLLRSTDSCDFLGEGDVLFHRMGNRLDIEDLLVINVIDRSPKEKMESYSQNGGKKEQVGALRFLYQSRKLHCIFNIFLPGCSIPAPCLAVDESVGVTAYFSGCIFIFSHIVLVSSHISHCIKLYHTKYTISK